MKGKHSLFRAGSLSVCCVCVFFSISCSGGSGGGGGESGGRTTRTGLRLIHASVDGSPISVVYGDPVLDDSSVLQSSYYAQKVDYVPVSRGEGMLNIFRAHSPDALVYSMGVDLAAKTEYTLLAYGEVAESGMSFKLFADPISRPDPGTSRFSLLNALSGADLLEGVIDGNEVVDASFGEMSESIVLDSGSHALIVRTDRGRDVVNRSVILDDRGEMTFVVSGALHLGAYFGKAYRDFD